MADAVSIQIKGLEELDKKLQSISQEFAARSIVSAAYSANKIVVDAAIGNIQSNGLVDTGLLQSSIKRKKLIYEKDGTVVIITGVSKNVRGTDRNGRPRVPWRYANVLEPRYKFMEDAMQNNAQILTDKFVKALESRLKKYTK
jgi:hypothetical protein